MLRKTLKLALILAICFSPCILFAARIGNAIEPIGASRFSIAAGGSFVTDREMETNGMSSVGAAITDFDIEKLYESELRLIFGLTDNANVYIKGGAVQLDELQVRLANGQAFEIESEVDVTYGGGFNAVCRFGYEDEYFVGVAGDYSRFEVNAEEIEVAGANATRVSGEITKTEYQASLYMGAKVEVSDWFSLTPYVGGFWNKLNLDSDGLDYTTGAGSFTLNFDNDAKDEVGPAAGVSLNFSDTFSLNVEGRYIAGPAVSAGGRINF